MRSLSTSIRLILQHNNLQLLRRFPIDMNSINTINYVSVFFFAQNGSQKSWTTNVQISQKLHKQIKANAVSVTSNLGGGLHGHLEVVIPAFEYNNISGCHFVEPFHPGKLTIPDVGALHDAIRLCERHSFSRNTCGCQLIEKPDNWCNRFN